MTRDVRLARLIARAASIRARVADGDVHSVTARQQQVAALRSRYALDVGSTDGSALASCDRFATRLGAAVDELSAAHERACATRDQRTRDVARAERVLERTCGNARIDARRRDQRRQVRP